MPALYLMLFATGRAFEATTNMQLPVLNGDAMVARQASKRASYQSELKLTAIAFRRRKFSAAAWIQAHCTTALPDGVNIAQDRLSTHSATELDNLSKRGIHCAIDDGL